MTPDFEPYPGKISPVYTPPAPEPYTAIETPRREPPDLVGSEHVDWRDVNGIAERVQVLEAATLADLDDVVDTLAPASAEVLTFTGTEWDAAPVPRALPALSDVADDLAPSAGQVLTWDQARAQWLAAPIPEPTTLSLAELTDVADTLAPVAGDRLLYSGGQWTNGPQTFPVGNVTDRWRVRQGDTQPSWDRGETFNVRDYGAKGDGSTNDSPAFQAAINAAIAANGGTVFLPPANPGLWYSLATQLVIAPASGTQAWFSIEASTAPSTVGIRWAGGSNTSVFQVKGWKYGHCQGVGVYLGAVSNVVVFDIVQQGSANSCGWVDWERCHHNYGTGRCNVGWRFGAAVAGGEASFHHFRNCSQANGVIDNTKGHVGWQNYDPNHLVSQWDNCGGSYLTWLYSALSPADHATPSVDATQTTIPLVSTISFLPAGRVKIDTEEIDYTALSGNSLTGCTRGVNGTTPATHVINSIVYAGVQNPLTLAWAYQLVGGAAMTFNGCGGSGNRGEFQSQRGVITVNGGRWEVARRLFQGAYGGSGSMDANVQGITFAVTTQPTDGVIVALGNPGGVTFDNCAFYGSDYTAPMFTAGGWDGFGGPVNAGTLAVRNCSIRGAAGDTFWTMIPSWQVDSTGSYRTNASGQFAQFLDGANGEKLRAVTFASPAADKTATIRDDVILVDATGGAVTITLPPAANKWQLIVKRTSAANNVIVDANASETIDGALTKTLSTQYALLALASDGANVNIVGADGTIT